MQFNSLQLYTCQCEKCKQYTWFDGGTGVYLATPQGSTPPEKKSPLTKHC